MIVGSRSSLSIYSDQKSAAGITKAIGIEPHESNEKGEPTRAARAGRMLEPEFMVHRRARWTFNVDESLVDSTDETGFGSLKVLVDVFRDRAEMLRDLRAECETVVWWSGSSDSSQGGFVMPADLLADLALLGCDLYGTTYLDVEDES